MLVCLQITRERYAREANTQDLSSSWTGLGMGPPSGNGTELQLAFAPFQTFEFAGLNLVLQIPGGLEQRRFERVVPGLSLQGRAMNQQRRLPRMAGGLGVQPRSGNLQPYLHAKGWFDPSLVFEDDLGGSYRRQTMQVFELFLDLTMPCGLGVKAEIAKSGFHRRSGMGLWLRRTQPFPSVAHRTTPRFRERATLPVRSGMPAFIILFCRFEVRVPTH